MTAATVFAGLAGFYIHSDPEHASLDLPQGDYDIRDGHPGPRVQRRRLLPLQARRRPRLPRGHDPGQRPGRPAPEGPAAPVPAALPQRLQRPPVRARARQRSPDGADRLRRRPARRRRSCARRSRCEPAERVEVLVDFSKVGVGSAAGPEEHDRRGDHAGRHALRRGRRRRQGGGAHARRSSSSCRTCRRSTRRAPGR